MNKAKLNVGLLGLGRLGQVYARSLRSQVSGVNLVAVCDSQVAAVDRVAKDLEVTVRYTDAGELIRDSRVDAIVIATPTHVHRAQVEAAARAGKPIFCEKPPAISLDDAKAMKAAVDQAGVFFQMGFMRRFDRGYAAAKKLMDGGEIGKPVVFKSTSRDPSRPSLEYLRPESSGGIFIDLGIHDFDLALWLFGEVAQVHSIGGVLAYPEMEPVGDIDNAIVSLCFADGRVGVIDMSRSGVYGYDISTEIVGTEGTLRVGYLRETPVTLLQANRVSHDTVPFFMERFAESYTAQLQNFADNVRRGAPPPITVDDGVHALRLAIAATRSYHSKGAVAVASIE